MRPVAEPAVHNGDRTNSGLDAPLLASPQEHLAVAPDGMRRLRVPVGVAPGPVLAGHRQLLLELFEIGAQFPVLEWPVSPNAVGRKSPEVRGVETGGVAGEVDHRAADAPARVIGAERHRVVARYDPRLVPVQLVGTRFVADPVPVGIPERAGLEHHYPPPIAGQALGQDAASGATTHDDQVDLLVVVVAAHVGDKAVIGASAVVWHQPGRLVTRPQPADRAHVPSPARAASCAARAFSARCAHGTGSAASRSATSHGSRRPGPMFL